MYTYSPTPAPGLILVSIFFLSFFFPIPSAAAMSLMPNRNIGDSINLPLLRSPQAIAVLSNTTTLVGDDLKLYLLNNQTRAVKLVATLPFGPTHIVSESPSSDIILDNGAGPFGFSPTGEVRRVNLTTGTTSVLATGFVLPYGFAFESVNTALLTDSNGIWRVSLLTGTTTQLAQVSGVGGIAIEPGGRSAVFPIQGSYEVDRINLLDNSISVVSTTLSTHGSAGVTSGSIAISRDGSFAVYTAGMQAGIMKINLATGEGRQIFFIPPGWVSLGGNSIVDLALSPDDTRVLFSWLTPDGPKISEVVPSDADIPGRCCGSFESLTDITWGITPAALALQSSSTALIISQSYFGSLSRINLDTGAPTLIGGGFAAPVNVALIPGTHDALISAGKLAARGGSLWKVDLATNTFTFIRDIQDAAMGLVVEPSGTTALFTTGDTLSRLDIASGTISTIVDGLPQAASITLPNPTTAIIGSTGQLIYKVNLLTNATSTEGIFLNPPQFVASEDATHVLVGELGSTLWRKELSNPDPVRIANIPVSGNITIEPGGQTALLITNTGITRVRIQEVTPPLTACNPSIEPCASSVAFLPGLEASRLYRQETDFLGFTHENQLWEPNRNADVQTLFLDPGGKSVSPNVYTRDVIDESFGTPIFGYNIYKNFIASMDRLKTDRIIKDWKSFPYDWRLDVDTILNNGVQFQYSVQNMIEGIENLAANSPTHKVTIITHSNGGLLAKALINKLKEKGEANIVDKLIMVAPPQLGTPAAVAGMLHGDEQDLGFGYLLSKQTARELAEHMPGGYTMLPSESYFNRVQDPVIEFDPSVDQVNNFRSMYGNAITTKAALDKFLLGDNGARKEPTASDLDTPNVLQSALLAKATQIHQALDTWTPPVGIDVTQIVGWGISTIRGIKYTTRTGCSNFLCGVPLLDREPLLTDDGDGTVVSPSADALNNQTFYFSLNKYNKELVRLRRNRQHKDILEADPIEELVKNIVKNVSSLPRLITPTKPVGDSPNLHISIHSPVSLDAYDSFGNHTGLSTTTIPNSDLTFIDKQIPNSSYFTFGEGKYITLDTQDSYKLKLTGLAPGTFTFKVETAVGTTSITTLLYENIPVASTTKATIDLGATSSPLKIDIDDDGTVDFSLKSGENLSATTTLDMMAILIKTLKLKKGYEKNLLQDIKDTRKFIEKEKPKQIKQELQELEKRIQKNRGDLISPQDVDALISMIEAVRIVVL